MKQIYQTSLGTAYQADANDLLGSVESDSVDLIITSPPFALQRQKEYGNKTEVEYINWLLSFGPQIHRVLKDTGSFVIDLGGAYRRNRPVRSLYNYQVLLRFCEEFDFRLAEEFFWHNPAKLPSPIEWVNKRKIRAKDSVDTIWWMSKTDFPKADVRRVLTPYSDRMKKLLENPELFYQPAKRPSGHSISRGFDNSSNGGAIPSNLLQFSNTDSNSVYLHLCKKFGIKQHPARFPSRLPEFFIKFLTEEGDMIIDPFAGSNTTGATAEAQKRRWISGDLVLEYIAASIFRFATDRNDILIEQVFKSLMSGTNGSYEIPRCINTSRPNVASFAANPI